MHDTVMVQGREQLGLREQIPCVAHRVALNAPRLFFEHNWEAITMTVRAERFAVNTLTNTLRWGCLCCGGDTAEMKRSTL